MERPDVHAQRPLFAFNKVGVASIASPVIAADVGSSTSTNPMAYWCCWTAVRIRPFEASGGALQQIVALVLPGTAP
jgi:hypothetical protein